MTTVISFASQKGGVGKTTSSVNLSAALAIGGYRVLMIDLDPQGSVRASFGYVDQVLYGTRELYLNPDAELDDVYTETNHENLDFIFSNITPLTDEQSVLEVAGDRNFLQNWIAREVEGEYDFVVIDAPPSTGALSLNALVAADLIVSPLQCEALAIKSLRRFLQTFKQLQMHVTPNIRIAGILLTMYDKSLPMHRMICKQVYKALSDSVFKTIIPKCPNILEASALGQAVLNQNMKAIGSTAYVRFSNELLDRFSLR